MFASLRALITVLIGLIAGAPAPTAPPGPTPTGRLHASTMPALHEHPAAPLPARRLAYGTVTATAPALPGGPEFRCIIVIPAPAIIR